MNVRLNRNPFVYLTISVCMLLLAVAGVGLFQQQHDEDAYVHGVQNGMTQLSNTAQVGIYNLKQQIKSDGGFNFSNLLQVGGEEVSLVYFIYNDKKELIYWSDNRLDLTYEDFKGYYLERCLQKGKSVYFVRKSNIVFYNQDYEIVAVKPIFFDYHLENSYLPKGGDMKVFPETDNIQIRVDRNYDRGEKITNRSGAYLFTLEVASDAVAIKEIRWFALLCLSISLVSFSCGFFLLLRKLVRAEKVVTGLLVLTVTALLIRLVMESYNFMYDLFPYEMFRPHDFNFVTFSKTQFGTVLNAVAILLLLIYISKTFSFLVPLREVFSMPLMKKQILGGIITFLTYCISYYLVDVLQHFFKQANTSVAIFDSFQNMPSFTLGVCLLICCAAVYFWTCHVGAKLILKMLPVSSMMITMAVSTLLFFMTVVFQDNVSMTIFNVNAVYFTSIALLGLPRRFLLGHYTAFLYVVSCALAMSVLGTYAAYEYSKKSSVYNMRQFAAGLLNNEDMLESYLGEIVTELRNDNELPEIIREHRSEYWEKDRFLQRLYLNNYFEKYDITVSFFDGIGKPLNGKKTLNQEVRPFMNSQSEKIRKYVFALNDPNTGTRSYICAVPIEQQNSDRIVGYVLLKMKAKRFSFSNAHHFFIKNGHFRAWQNDYSYAIYYKNELVYSFGDFKYSNDFLNSFRYKDLPHLMRRETSAENHSHLRIPDGIDKNIVVSVADYSFRDLYAIFSFQYLLLVFVLLTALSAYNYMSKPRDYQVNFSTKIQLYLNVAFFVPIIIVGIVVMTVMSSQNSQELKDTYIDKAQSVATYLFNDVLNYNRGDIQADKLKEKIYDLSGVVQSDIHFYDRSGKLVASSDDYLFEVGLLSVNINPEAYAGIAEDKLDKLMLFESVGSLDYNTVYVGIKALNTGELQGFFSIPFFRSAYNLDRQVIEVLATVMEVFSVVLMLLLPLSFMTSYSLLKPLKLIRQKLSNTTFSAQNEPLEYHARDEFGLLIGEYNRMLNNLEDSKKALSRSEKESAWREMAKQVAHEIKNPLTPMRLTIQQLQRVINTQEDHRIDRALNMMLTQIDTLSDIATSFSAFAQMPLPKEEVFEISRVLKQAVTLHRSQEDASIDEIIPEGKYLVLGDEKLMGRVFTNLILNGIQAVEEGVYPHIVVSLRVNAANKVVIEFKDNGQGIPENIQPKVFTPNFTTKTTGSGVGLALSKRGIEHTGGSIWFETEDGKGTSFFVEMPLVEIIEANVGQTYPSLKK
ncbi:HAMP domain-containing sensor histidine kinase [Limibacter armeniacum]|uniref:HAMP domain-containing sensor histidine kinase n=1 Tax=Limibacter armeniacum TaxID=466084 RepID=UPI002FE63830